MTVLAASTPSARRSARRLAGQVDSANEFGSAVREIFEGVASGDELIVLWPHREVTPAGAAALLGVTRQYVDRLLAEGTLDFRRLPGSTHRRVKVRDVMALVEARGRRRRGAAALRSALRTPARER
jgi:excisionase family DNA binding protein